MALRPAETRNFTCRGIAGSTGGQPGADFILSARFDPAAFPWSSMLLSIADTPCNDPDGQKIAGASQRDLRYDEQGHVIVRLQGPESFSDGSYRFDAKGQLLGIQLGRYGRWGYDCQ